MTDKAMPPEPNNKLPTKEQDGWKQQTLTWIDSLIALDELDNHVLRTLKAMLAAAPEPAPQEPKSEPAGATSAAEKQVGSPVGAAPLPDGVAAMVERLALIYGRSAISADNEDYLCMFSLKDCREVKEMLERLARELAKHQESSFHPDWSMLEATRESLREHMRELAAVKVENEEHLANLYAASGVIMGLRGELAAVKEQRNSLRAELQQTKGQLQRGRLGELRRELSAVKAENEKLREDAERYRWLRDQKPMDSNPKFDKRVFKVSECDWSKNLDPSEPHNYWASRQVFGDDLDAAIDAAMKGEK